MHVFSDLHAADLAPRDLLPPVDEFAGTRNHDDAADTAMKIIHGAKHLERQLRQPIAERRERHPLKHNIGHAAECRRTTCTLPRADEAIRLLVLSARIEPPRHR